MAQAAAADGRINPRSAEIVLEFGAGKGAPDGRASVSQGKTIMPENSAKHGKAQKPQVCTLQIMHDKTVPGAIADCPEHGRNLRVRQVMKKVIGKGIIGFKVQSPKVAGIGLDKVYGWFAAACLPA